MSVLTTIGRYVLIFTNVIFLLVSTALIVTGIILLQSFDEVFEKHVDPVVDDIKKAVNTLFGSTPTENLDLLQTVYHYFAVGFLVSGCIFLVIALSGLIGSCCQIKYLLFFYAFVSAVFLIPQAAILFLFIFRDDLMKKGIERPLKDVTVEYQGSNGTNAETWAWNYVMWHYSCCGIDDYQDFTRDSIKWWARTEHLTPYMCCTPFPTTTAEASECAGASSSAAVSTIAEKSNYNKGCVDKVWERLVKKNTGYCIIGVFVLFILQILVVVFSCILAYDLDDSDNPKTQVHPHKHRSKPSRPKNNISPMDRPPDYW